MVRVYTENRVAKTVNATANNRERNALFSFSIPVFALSALLSTPCHADDSWFSATFDNDLFVQEDNGYTNGLYGAFYEVNSEADTVQNADVWVTPLLWSIPEQKINTSVNIYSGGQSLNTPDDLDAVVPAKNTFPYSALLSFTNTYIAVTTDYADKVSTTLGVVGPLAMGEEAQKVVHKVIGAQPPKGWDTQINNELVFELSRGRTWRTWVSDNEKTDFLSGVEMSIGTIRSSVSSGFMLRYGTNLRDSFPSVLLTESRTSNPIAVSDGWFVYAGVEFSYIFNEIFTDGNTFRDSRSIDYDPSYNVLLSGVTYSWGDIAVSFAINSPFSIDGDKNSQKIDRFTRYGTLTVSWKI